MGELTFGGGGRQDKNLVGGDLLGGVSQVWGNKQMFSLWEGPSPILHSRKTNIYIYTTVPACVLTTLANHNPAIFSVPGGTEKLRQTKRTENSSVLPMFNNNTRIDFRTAYNKHVLILSYFIQAI